MTSLNPIQRCFSGCIIAFGGLRSRRAPLMCTALIAALGLVSGHPARAESTGDNLWRGLREQFPFHLQTVGLSAAGPQGERTLIIAEPPPTLPRASFQDALRAIFGDALREAHLKRQPIGYDGWVEDIVASLRYSPADPGKRLNEDMTLLAERLYGTAYKFAPIRLPANRQAGPMAPPSLRVSAAELKNWLLDSGAPLTSVDIGSQHRLSDLLGGGRPGVYLSPERGLVILVLPRDFPIDAYRGEIHKFALDSDAVVGAIAAGDRRLALIGRERDTPLDAVPPLRAESVLALAATAESQLAQSYERRDAFAGKLPSGPDSGKDWAPIYLSRDLVNTEFGSLLNLTDQMLKSWSEAGKIEYVHFPYPKPATFPFDKGLLRSLGADEVTYNWNTVGVGSVFTFPEARIFALTRTGSLPVSYFPEGSDKASSAVQEAITAEDRGYNYFSALRDPYLGRVVQYSAIYQVFRAFPVEAERDVVPPPNYRSAADYILAKTIERLRSLEKGEAAPDPAFLEREIANLAQEGGRQLDNKQINKILAELTGDLQKFCAGAIVNLNKFEEDVGQDITERVAVNLADRQAMSSRTKLQRVAKKADAEPDADFRSFVAGLSAKERNAAIDLFLLENDDTKKLIEDLHDCLEGVTNMESVKAGYLASARPIESGYIKTASIVLSSNPSGTGGHNLYSRATQIELTTATPEGQIAVAEGPNGEKVLRLNPKDAARSNELARVYERHADEPSVRAMMEAELARGGVVRNTKIALQLNEVPATEGRGLTRALEGDTIGEPGFRSLPDDPAVRLVAKQAEARGLDLAVAREGDGFLVFRLQPKPIHAVRAPTEPGMVEMVNAFAEETASGRLPTGLPPLRFGAVDGITEGELLGIIKTQQLRTATGGGGNWGRPPHIRTLTGDGEAPRGWFFGVEGDGDGAISYGRRGPDDEIIVLRAVKESGAVKEALRKSVDWKKAEIKPVDVGSVPSGTQLTYELSIPIKSTSWFSFRQSSLLVRAIGYFKRLLSESEIHQLDTALRAVVERNASQNLVAADGIADLKAEILREVRPDRLEFHLDFGAGDLIVVERQSGRVDALRG